MITSKVFEIHPISLIVTLFLNALFTKPYINLIKGLVKSASKNITITVTLLLEVNFVKKTLNCPNIYGSLKRKRY